MKRYTSILMAGALVSALALPAAAQSDNMNPSARPSIELPRAVTGTVVSVSSTSLVVKLASGDQLVFIRDSNSTIPESLTPGAAVRVGYETPEPGTFHVSSVIVNAAGMNAAGSETMPGTASPLAAIGLLGILALGGGATLRALRG